MHVAPIMKNEAKRTRETSMGWMIQKVARRLEVAMNASLSELDISLQQFAVMMIVLETEGQTQAQIGANFGMPAYAISRALDHLENAGYLKRRPHPTSRRTHTIHTTKKGEVLAPKLFAIVKDVNETLTEPFSSEERAVFHNLLVRLV